MPPSPWLLPSGRALTNPCPNPRPSPEAELAEHAERLARSGVPRVACWVNLSRLRPHHRRDRHLRVAAELFEAEIRAVEGRMFALSDGDIVFVAAADATGPADAAVRRLRLLFAGDPLARLDRGRGDFCTWFRLDADMHRFLGMARARRDAAVVPAAEDGGAEEGDGERGTPLRPAQLAALEETLGRADLSNHVRNQTVCALFDEGGPRRVFDEIYVSTRDLAEAVLPGVDLTADPWLFQSLTRTLDRRILALVCQAVPERAFSLNLNVSTLLSPEFRRFDGRLNARLRGRLVIELGKLDVFADMAGFAFAREFVRERGYRLCLDGLTHLTLPYVDRERLGFDLVKLRWSPEMAAGHDPALGEEIRRLVAACGHARVVLSRCDGKAAVEAGRAMGISMFQGRWVERLLRAGIAPSPVGA
jgi:EAL domain-containing protein (putative c-di-GMP-specific phosphodiesterase class I)